MIVEAATKDHILAWGEMRADLWPETSPKAHRLELEETLAADDGSTTAFVAISSTGYVVGFAEASLRRDYVNGCDTSPVAFLEGIYVRPRFRRAGTAGLLLEAVEGWGRSAGCTELGSDTDWKSVEGVAFHSALGFEETERVIFFKKTI